MFDKTAVVAATGVAPATFANWTAPSSGVVLLHDTDRPAPTPGGGRGTAKRYDLASVVAVAIMVELQKFGIGPSVSASQAAMFTHCGQDHFDDDTDTSPVRNVGELFPTGKTLLVVRPGRTCGDVINVQSGQPFFSFWSDAASGDAAVITLDCNAIVARVRQRLGIE
jgi:hypothetical protein